MNDEEILTGLREAARRRDAAGTGTALDAPLDEAFVARVASRVAPPRRRGRMWIAVPSLAMAAGLLLWLTASRSPTMAPLPAYSVEVHGGVDALRGAPASSDAVTARAGASLELLLRPADDVTGKVEAHPFVVSDGRAREVPAKSRVSASGAIELHLDVNDATGQARDVVLAVVVSRAEGPGDLASIATGERAPAAGTVVEHVSIHLTQ